MKIIPDEEAFEKCAWCSKKIIEDSEVYGFGIKFSIGFDVSEAEGFAIEFPIISQNKRVPMVITTEGSDAKNDGNEGMLLTCSLKCGNELRETLLLDKSLGELFEDVKDLNG